MKIAKQAEQIRAEPPPLPGRGPYRVIVADPPWPYGERSEDPSKRGVRPYPTMSIAEICALSVVSVAHHDCVLWLWTTNQHMREFGRITGLLAVVTLPKFHLFRSALVIVLDSSLRKIG